MHVKHEQCSTNSPITVPVIYFMCLLVPLPSLRHTLYFYFDILMWPLVTIVESKYSKQINMIADRYILIILFWVIMLDYNRLH
jgi:hypothetical protein